MRKIRGNSMPRFFFFLLQSDALEDTINRRKKLAIGRASWSKVKLVELAPIIVLLRKKGYGLSPYVAPRVPRGIRKLRIFAVILWQDYTRKSDYNTLIGYSLDMCLACQMGKRKIFQQKVVDVCISKRITAVVFCPLFLVVRVSVH